MKPITPEMLPVDSSEEIATLIETLHQTGQRLEQLTGGEVDSVATPAGETFLLQHAQDQLRLNEAARQVAILNALPASIALLDSQGMILTVNEAWQEFGRANAAHTPGHDIGVNYLTICDEARGDDAAVANEATSGIREVLDGKVSSFTLEYPCHSPAEQRWFLMTVTPMAGHTSKGVVVMHLNITERRQMEQERDRATGLLGERLKELLCLYTISTAVADSGLSVEQLMQRSVETIPPAFQYPEVACARLSLRGRQYKSGDFKETEWRLASAIVLDGEEDGELEVFYTEERPASDVGPFLQEEQELVGTVTRMVRDYYWLKLAMSQLQQFRDLLDDSNDSVYVIDPDTGRFIDVNGRACTSLGYSRDELLRMTVIDVETTVVSKSTWDGHVEAMRKAGPMLQEGEQRRKDGSTFPVEISEKYVSHMGNNYIVAIARDITERRQAQDKLSESEEEFHTLAESMPQIVWITRADGWNIYFNQHWMEYTGLTLEQSLGHGWNIPFHPDDQQPAWEAWQKAVEGIGIYSIESRLRRADGEYRWWLVRGVPLKDDDGNISKWFGTCTDIHDLKMAGLEIDRANGELRHREAELAESQRITRIGSWELTPATGTIAWSAGLNLVLARDIDSPAPTFEDVHQFYTPESWQRMSAAIAVTIDTGVPYDLELEMIDANGAVCWTSTHGEAVRGTDSAIVMLRGTVQDITDRRKAETSIKSLNRVLAMLSGINTLIVHVKDRDELFKGACNIAIKAGGFSMAMIVTVDPVAMMPVSITTSGKDEELLAGIKNVMSTSEGMQTTLVALAISENKSIIANDTQNDSRLLFGKQYAEAGVMSMIVIPLIISGEAAGTLALYASELEFFQEDEMKLLTELASDIAYAIDHIDKQERLNYVAYYDVLTGLANRTLFLERVTQYMRSANTGGHKLALGLIDLERFKNINESLGRPAGDVLLQKAAEWLSDKVGNASLLARIDADHFAIILPKIKSDGNLTKLVENLMVAFQEHAFELNDGAFRISAKVGIAVFPDDGSNADTLYTHAEAALKKAKLSGVRYLFYTQEMTEAVADKLALENQLRRAIDKEEFELYYHPKVNIVSGKVTSAEALIRWNDPITGLVPPGKFIPILEETGLIFEVGRWALLKAIEDNMRWRAAGLATLRTAVNVSPLQLRNINFIDEIKQIVAFNKDAAEGLELEITESLIMDNVEENIERLQAIRALGITIAIDDFGTGFSSLNYLSKLPVDTLKIDRAFVIEMDKPEGLALVTTIIVMAHELNLKIVAEGVETEQQMRQLLSLNCDEMQGFLFSKPVPADIFAARFLAPPAPSDE